MNLFAPACLAILATTVLTATLPMADAPAAAHRHPDPIVIGHRGASGYRPEHTLASYRLAIEQGADVIEPDLVVTRDGALIARHENEIGGTTDVAQHQEFANRRTTKTIDGVAVTGWFAEDFTLAEIKTLRARERLPQLRSTQYDGQFEVPTFAEVIALAQASSREVAIYPETKHPTFFAEEGRYLDGTPIRQSLGQLMIDELVKAKFTDRERVYVQSFEVANLVELKREIMPKAGVDFPLMQLVGDLSATGGDDDFSMPYDLRYGKAHGLDVASRYPGLATPPVRYADLAKPEVLAWMHKTYATGIAPWKDDLLRKATLHPIVAAAKAQGLRVHTYTLRAEAQYRTRGLSYEAEVRALLDGGVDGFFTDNPDLGVAARDAWVKRRGE
jgi:glycerophosphoryl diester phosphodiesterase